MPKSWHFRVCQRSHWQPGESDLVTVTLVENGDEARLLVIEAGESAALCILAQPELVVGGKTMVLGDAIKIMHDRLQPGTLNRRSVTPEPVNRLAASGEFDIAGGNAAAAKDGAVIAHRILLQRFDLAGDQPHFTAAA